MEYCKLKPEDINDESIQKYIEKLKIIMENCPQNHKCLAVNR